MDTLTKLINYIKEKYSTASITINDGDACDFIDIVVEKKHIVIEFNKENNVFGISLITKDTGYGERPDASFNTLEELQTHLIRMLS